MATTKIIKPEGLSGGRTIITDTQAPLPNPHSNARQPVPTTPEGVKDYIEILPKPVGYRMLVRPWSGEKKTKGGILLSDTTHEMIEMTTVVGLVIMMGDLCYKDKTKFPMVLGVKKDNSLFMDVIPELDLKRDMVNTVF